MSFQKSLLITGANGLLGRAVLRGAGDLDQIYPLVRSEPSNPLPRNHKPLVCDLSGPGELPEDIAPDTIVHLAQSSHHHAFPEKAQDVFDVNVGSTQRLLDWAVTRGTKRFVFASSGGIYGGGSDSFTEDAPLPAHPNTGHYIASKRCSELLALSYSKELVVVILRFFFIYGPEQRDEMLIPRLINNIQDGRPIYLQGSDGILMNPIFVDDAATAVTSALSLNKSDIINVAGPKAVSIREIGSLIGKYLGKEPVFQSRGEDEGKNLVGDITKLRSLLGEPSITPDQGLQQLISSRT